jgi:hypothetical protein
MKSITIFLLIISTLTGMQNPPTSKNLDIVLCVGQSNVVGTYSASIFRQSKDFDDQIRIYAHSGTRGAIDSTGWTALEDSPTAFGPEWGFARRYVRFRNNKNTTLGIVKIALNGSGIARFYEMPDYWNTIQSEVSTAISNAEVAGYKPRIIGLLWLHGHTDASNQTDADLYESRLTNLIAGYRLEWLNYGAVSMWVVLADHPPAFSNTAHAGTVRAAMQSVGATNSGVTVVSTENAQHVGDFVHYTTESKELIGRRMADAALGFQAQQ